MAVEFELHSDSINGGPLTYDLWDADYQIIEKTWTPANPWPEGDFRHVEFGAQVTFSHYTPHSESFSLITKDTEANVHGIQTSLEAFFNKALRSNIDPSRPDYTWLKVKTDDETTKRSLIYRAMCAFPPRDGVNFFLDGVPSAILIAAMSLDRHPFWESYYEDVSDDLPTISGGAGADAIGTSFTYTNVPGTARARLAYSIFGTNSTTALTRAWIGIREEYAGTAQFNARHECENAALASGALYSGAAVAADVTASSGNKVQVPFNVLATFGIRFDTRFGDIGLVYSQHMIGRYSVLMRAKVTAGATVRAQLRYGSSVAAGSTRLQPSQDVYISDSAWHLYELGEIQIPEYGTFPEIGAYGIENSYFRMQIWAEHVTGTAATDNFDCDTFVFIPSDHMIRIDNTAIEQGAYVDDLLAIYTRPNDTLLAVTLEGASVPAQYGDFSPRTWYLPEGDGVVVMAAQRAAGSVLGDTIEGTMSYVPRWMSYNDT